MRDGPFGEPSSASRRMTVILNELDSLEHADQAAAWIVLTDALLKLTNEERAGAWRGAAVDADKRLTAGRARLDQLQAELAQVRQGLGPNDV